MSSLRAEHGGVIALLLFLRYFEYNNKILTPYTIKIYIDNTEVLSQSTNQYNTQQLSINEKLDYNVWQTQLHVILLDKNKK